MRASDILATLDEALDIASKRDPLQGVNSPISNVNILLGIHQLPAHPGDHSGVVRAEMRWSVNQRDFVFVSDPLDHPSELLITSHTPGQVL